MSSITTNGDGTTLAPFPPTTATANQRRLCLACQGLSLSQITSDGFVFHRTFGQLSQAAGDVNGCCDLCVAIWWSLRWHASKLAELETVDVVLYRNPPAAHEPIKQVDVVVAPEWKRSVFSWSEDANGEFHLGPPDDKPWLARGHVKVFSTSRESWSQAAKPAARYSLPAHNSGSSACLDLASRWLSDCLEHHGDTCQANTDVRLPRRVIDVGPSSTPPSSSSASVNETANLRLVTTTHGQRGAYIALSYCWGTKPFFTMNSDNKSDLEQSIDLNVLPKTVQDAVALTRHLGVRYLWVDSLCIIQGSDEEALKDWDDQSRSMNTVYRGAMATILASAAASAHEGIFSERRAPGAVSCEIPVRFASAENVLLVGDEADDMVSLQEPLEKRAWAFQENFLSIRALSFGTDELSWRCGVTRRRERDSESEFLVKRGDREALHIHETWSAIVEEYSGRELTVPTDRLPGIAGLARLVQAYLPPFYVSGLWEDRVVEQLLWRHVGNNKNSPSVIEQKHEQQQRDVPSWSWASVDGKVEFLSGADPGYCKVLRLGDRCIVMQAHLVKIASVRLAATANYFGGYDNYLPWAVFPARMRTHLDDPATVPDQHRKMAPGGGPEELIDTWFMFLGPSCGLILTREKEISGGRGRGHLRRRSEGSTINDGHAIRPGWGFSPRRGYRRIGVFTGLGHGFERGGRLPSKTVYLT